MRTETIKIYKFNELSDESKLKAVEEVQNDESYLSYDWWDSVYEWFKDKYGEVFNDIDPSFSGFWSQGDGASFLYSGIDRDKVLELWIESEDFSEIRKKFYREYLDIYSKGHRYHCRYVHENSVTHMIEFDLMYNNSVSGAYNVMDHIADLEEDFEHWFHSYYKDICGELYRTLEADYEYLMSYEAIKDHLIDNDYEFEENGKRY